MARPASTRRALLTAVSGTAATAGLAGCSSLLEPSREPTATASESDTPEPPETGTGTGTPSDEGDATVAALGVATTDADYAVLGQQDATETATLFGGWKCPYTQEFVNQMLSAVIERYVASGDLAIEFRAVSFQTDESWGDDEPRANHAGQAVWHESPQQFPEYVATVFTNQPPEQTEWATVDKLVSFADTAGVEDTAAIRESVTEGEYTDRWQATQDLVLERGIRGIPRLELGGEITAPTIDPDATERQLKRTLE